MKTAKHKVAKRQPTPSTPAVLPAPLSPPAPISATLSPQASELVRWYCGITKHFEHNAVEGAVYGVLERAKDAYEGTRGMDEAFDWLMEDVLKARNDDVRFPVRRAFHGGYTPQLGQMASALLSRYVNETGNDERDVVSGALLSMLGSVLDDTSVSLSDAIAQAKESRLADEKESRRRSEALAAFYARKEVAV